MRLIDDPRFLAGAMTKAVVDVPAPASEVAEFIRAVQEFLKERRRVEFLLDANFVGFIARTDSIDRLALGEFAGFIERARERRRRACSHEDDDCSCESVRRIVWENIATEDPDAGSLSSWAAFTQAELERRFNWLYDLALLYLAIGMRRHSAGVRLTGLPAHDPDKLLIAPLTSAPGAPPAVPSVRRTEGHLAAAA